jgi:preprotein translocase subunit SecG
MFYALLVIHLLICLSLVGVVLVQSGKGGGLQGGTFGGTAQTVFGGRGAIDFITRATMILGAAFFLTSVALALLRPGNTGPARSLIQEEARKASQTAPRVPTPAPSAPAPTGAVPATPAPAK